MSWLQNYCYNHINKNADYKMVDYFFNFVHPFTCVISGPTMSGKTIFVSKLINLNEQLIKPTICQIHFYYSEWQSIYESMKNTKFFKKVPNLDDYKGGEPILIIIDDLMVESNNKLTNFFTKGAHHRNLSVIYISQNLYNSNSDNRTLNLNVHYLVIFKNPRDMLQIQHLGRSILVRNFKEFEDAYIYATRKPFGYILIDLKQRTPDQFRYMTNVLNDHPYNTVNYTHQDVLVLNVNENQLEKC